MRFKKSSSMNSPNRFIAIFTPVALVVLFGLILQSIILNNLANSTWASFGGVRLAPAFSLIKGYQLYYGPEGGPISGEIYGPVKTLLYLPATIANSPTAALIIGGFMNAGFFFLPILLLHIGKNVREPQKVLIALSAFICFGLLTFKVQSLNSAAHSIHADAPALGLSAFACAILYFRKHKDGIPALLCSATFAVLAVWTKQVAVPILLALPTYVLLADGRQCFKRYVTCIFFAGIGISTLLFWLFDPQNVFFNMFTIPGHHPLKGNNNLTAIIYASHILLNECLLPMVVIVFHILYSFPFRSDNSAKLKIWLSHNQWTMLLIVSLYMVPTSLLNNAVVGGAIGALSYTSYFLYAAATLILAKYALDSTSPNNENTITPGKLLVTVLVVAMTCNYIYPVYRIKNDLHWLRSNPNQVAYDYLKKYPGEVYFPLYPLPHIMAEGKLYHTNWGLEDRATSGFRVSDEQFRAHIPRNIKLMASIFGLEETHVMTLIPECSLRIEVDELPNWTVYACE